MNQEFNISNSAANIQKVVPVKRNGYILELQLPAPNLDSNLFVQQSSQSSNSLNSNNQQTNNSNQVIEDQELPEKVEAQKFNNSKLEQFKNLFRR
jgi:hypothetical protein